ncbi:MAG: ribonuclease D [Gammaproteobacteria bacterium]|nr:ribonuclease D [Gammaproteobacteria bacterium]
MTDYLYIDTDAALEAACRRWQGKTVLAVDTEFVRVRTFYPQLGLIQVADDQGAALIDPLSLGSLQAFAELLANPAITKLIHSCSEDLEVLHRACGVLPAGLFDTQIAASYAGLGLNLGYARLVQELLGIEVAKDASRTDWLKRPLDAEQLNYAAADVTHLLALYPSLLQRLQATPHFARFAADCAALLDTSRFDLEPDKAYRKVKQAFRLKPQQLAVLKVLAAWREEEAVKRDLVRRFLISDEALIALAQYQPRNLPAMQTIGELSPQEMRKHGIQLLALVEMGKQAPESEWPAAIIRPNEIPGMKAALTEAKAVAESYAKEIGLAPELVASNRLLEGYLLCRIGLKSKPPSQWLGWRGEALESRLAEVVAAQIRATSAPERCAD